MLDQNRYYITTAIPYVNAKPHIGFALEIIQADTFARYHRLRGDDTYFLTGTDDNSLTNVLAAEQESIPPRELVERNARHFLALRDPLDLSFDQFIRTSTDARHVAGVQKLWRAVDRKGDIYKQSYQGLYCVRCEQYYTESELVNGLCPVHRIPPEIVREENYFFRLSRYMGQLHSLITSDQLRIIPNARKNEVLSFISQGLEDFSISRSQSRARGWGIPVPGDVSQVVYVWFDALANYITALGYDSNGSLFQQYWLHNLHRVHAIGKGITRFHAVYWPAMLLSADLPLPGTIFVHGYINVDGVKMSKSLGNVIDPVALVDAYGTDAARYYFLRAVSPTGDANFTWTQFDARYHADLANDLGNLLNRTISMLTRYRGGRIPAPSATTDVERSVQQTAARSYEQVLRSMEGYDPQTALDAIWELITRVNRYLEERAPWTLAKQARADNVGADERLNTALYTAAEALRVVASLLEPFLPTTASRMLGQLGAQAENIWPDCAKWGGLRPGSPTGQAEPIFPRVERAEVAAGAAIVVP